jgi:hypothetical protein
MAGHRGVLNRLSYSGNPRQPIPDTGLVNLRCHGTRLAPARGDARSETDQLLLCCLVDALSVPPSRINEGLDDELGWVRADQDADEAATDTAGKAKLVGLGESQLAAFRLAGEVALLDTSTPALRVPLSQANLSRRIDIPFQHAERLLDQLSSTARCKSKDLYERHLPARNPEQTTTSSV